MTHILLPPTGRLEPAAAPDPLHTGCVDSTPSANERARPRGSLRDTRGHLYPASVELTARLRPTADQPVVVRALWVITGAVVRLTFLFGPIQADTVSPSQWICVSIDDSALSGTLRLEWAPTVENAFSDRRRASIALMDTLTGGVPLSWDLTKGWSVICRCR
jgi:hypothetical protein